MLAERGTASVDWEAILPSLFSETVTSEDEELGSQIVKVRVWEECELVWHWKMGEGGERWVVREERDGCEGGEGWV